MVSTRRLIFTRARLISVAMIAVSPVVTALMSLLFHGEVRGPMLVTSVVCAIVVDRIVQRITRHYRARLRAVHDSLERRVQERTRDLERANQTLRTAALEQAALRAELIERDRLATAGMVAAGVSHEIRSPLTVITMALDEVLAHRHRLPVDMHELVVDADDAATRIEVILRDLMSLAKPADEPVVATDLASTIDSAIRLASYRLGKGVRLERAPIDVPPVRANASRLVQVFVNLITNAARATRADAVNHIGIGARVAGARVVIAITDTGCGMADETRARLFQPFFTTGGDSGGTGLGLVICRQMIERMGGSITLTSEVGVGTVVEIALQGCTAELSARHQRAVRTKRPASGVEVDVNDTACSPAASRLEVVGGRHVERTGADHGPLGVQELDGDAARRHGGQGVGLLGLQETRRQGGDRRLHHPGARRDAERSGLERQLAPDGKCAV